MKHFWLMFFKDAKIGDVYGSIHGHQCVADYRNHPHFIGWKMITIDLKELEK